MTISNGEIPVLELSGMWSTPLLPLLSCPLWPEVIVPVRVLFMAQGEIFNHLLFLKPFNCVQTNDWYWIELLILHSNNWNHRRCPWCNGYHRRKWTRWHEFKSWTSLIAFHMALIPLGKVWIQLFSLQLWVNSRTDWVLQPWWGN